MLLAAFPPPTTPLSNGTPTANAQRKLGIAVDLSDESAFAVKWAAVSEESKRKFEDEFDTFTTTKASDLVQPLVEAQFPYKIHIVKDHDMRERLCLGVERLGLSAVIMGSRGFGAIKRGSDGRLGSVSDYCVCPVVVVRYPDEKESTGGSSGLVVSVASATMDEEEPV